MEGAQGKASVLSGRNGLAAGLALAAVTAGAVAMEWYAVAAVPFAAPPESASDKKRSAWIFELASFTIRLDLRQTSCSWRSI